MKRKKIIQFAICLVLFFVFAYAAMFPGYQSPRYWICFPVVAAFLMTGPLSCVMLKFRRVGSTALLPLIFFVVAKLIGELKMPYCWVPFLLVILAGEVVRDLIGEEKLVSVRVAAPLTMCMIAFWNNGFYFGGDAFLKLSIGEMGETYTMAAKNMSTPLTYILILVGIVVASLISERLTERVIHAKAEAENEKTEAYYKNLTIQEFTKAADRYEGKNSGIYEMCKYDYPQILEEIEKEPFTDLLDAGCGPAPMISLLSEKYPDKHYTGIDLTEKMIAVAQAKQLPNATFIVGDCENLPFADNSFDVVICSMSAHHYPNVQNFYNSVFRVLRPGGRFILRDCTADGRFLRWFAGHIEMPLANACGHGDVSMLRREDVRSGLEQAGMTVLKCEAQKKMRLHVLAVKEKQ